mgnify:CR=1 FL=1
MKTGTNKKTLSLILASLLCVALTVFGIGNLSVFGNRQTKAAAGNAVAKVGETEYADLSSAFSALDANNYSLELLDEAAWAESTPVYWKTSKGNGYVATFAAALTASYMSDGGAITIVCRPGADVGTMTHGHVEDNLTVYGNGAYVSDGECDLEVDTFPYSRTTGRQVTSGSYLTSDVTITAYKLDNLGVWGQRNTGHTVNVNLYECNGKAIGGKTNFQRVYISGKTGVNNYNIVGCKFITASTSLYSNTDGKIVIKGCSFTGSKAPVNFNHKTDGDMTLTVENCSFASCGDDAEWKGFAAPVRFVNSGNGTMGSVVDGCAFENTVGANGDVLVGDGREGQASGDVAVSVKNTAAKVSVQQPGYYTSAGTVADESKAENATTVSDTPYISGENYTTIELTYGNEVAAEDIAAAKKLYEGVAYSTNKAANEAYMALYGVTWDKGYLDVTDNAAPLRKYAGVSGSVTEVKYLVHGEMAGFTSLQSNGNNIDSTVGGNHQIARTSYTILGVSDKDGNKARITDGNVQAYVAGGYDNMFAVSGTLKIENIEFTSTTSTTVGASAMNATGNSEKEVFGAKMVITDCIFRGRLYVYDNFDNAGKMTYEISKCVFDGSNYSGDSNAYAIFAQCRGGNELYIQNNKISGYARGINIDHPTVKATISENEISVTDKGRSCVQLSSLTSATVSNNELVLDGGNAITLHEKLLALSTVPEITFKNNNVTGTGYLVYDDAKANGKEFTNKNLALTFGENTIAETVDTTKGVKGSEVYDNKGYVHDVVNHIYGSVNNPYTLEAFSKLTRAEYIAAQEKLGGTIYVDVGDYAYDKYGVLGNGTADNNDRDTTKLNCYNQNGYLGEGNDGANGKNVVFVGSSVTNNVTGYTSIDNIGTYLLLAVPAYTNVTFKDITFNGVFSFNYQMYTGPWSQLGELKFDGCTFNSLIVGGLAAQGLNFTGCTFNSFTNSVSANNSNPIWIRPAYGNWSKGDNEGQGNDFKSLTSVVFAGNTVASTRPVKFERIAQWEMQTKVEVTGNSFDMASDGSNKNVGLYFGANAKFDLVLDNNKAAEGSKTVALYTAVYNAPDGKSYTGLPAGSTVKNAKNEELTVSDGAVAWKTTDKITLASTKEAVALTNAKGVTVNFATIENALAAAADGDTITLLADTNENVTIEAGKNITLDLNGFTLNGGTGTAKAAILNYGTVVIKDSSKAATGTIKRDDSGIVGETSYYVIRNLGTMTIESGNIENNSGYRKANSTGAMIGSSLICNGDDDPGAMLTIKGGKFTQLNFIAIKNGALGNLIVTGGEITSEHSAIQNWFNATVTGGTIKGQLWTDAWKEGESVGNTVIGEGANFSGEIVMDITGSVVPTLEITGGTLNVTNWRITKACETAGGKPQVSGGTFTSAVDESYCAAGFIPTLNEDGTHGVKEGKFLVRVNGKGFETLAEAIKAAVDGDTITLLENVTVEGKQIVIDKNVTIDLNGKTLKVSKYTAKAAQIDVTGKLTVKDGAEGGLICSDYTGTAGLVVCIENGGKFTLESGTITTEGMAKAGNAVKISAGGEFVMNGGTVKADAKRANRAVNVTGSKTGSATFTMNGGSIIADKDPDGKETSIYGIVGSYYSNIALNGGSVDAPQAISAGSSTISVKDGDYKGTIAVKNGSISGGTFDALIDYRYLADGYVLEEKPDGTYGLKEGKYVAVIGTVGYESLQAAINAAAENETVKLVADTNENVTIEAGKNITLELNGFTLNGGTGTAKAAILNYGTVVIKDSSKAATGTIKRDDSGIVGETSYYVIRNLGTMTIESGNIENNSGYRKANSTGAMIGSSLICNGDDDPGAMLTIKGGKFTQLNFIAIKNGALGNLIVTGGEITSEHSAIQNWFNATVTGGTIKGQLWTDAWKEGESVGNTVIGEGANFSGEIVMDITGSVVPTLEITGGTLNVTNWRITKACETAGGKPQVSGGTFTSAVDESYCAAGFIPTLNEDGTHGVKEGKFLVRVNGKGFETLAEAIKAAVDGDTITILENIEVSEQIVIEKAVTIDLGGNTISNAYSGGSYSMLTKADVTIKNGTYKSTVSSARGIGAYANFNAEGLTVEAAGLVGIALSTANMTCNVTDSVIKAGYAIANFADDNKLIVNNSQVLGTDCGIYHNGTNKRFALTATDSKVVAGTEEKSEANNSTTGIYVSGSAKDESEYSNITLTGCTVMGGTAIEGKFVNLTLTDCIVTATASETSYVMNNNGATSLGFAVVITDNTTLATGKTPEPKGTIIITGDEGNYKGVVGLGNLASVKETYNDFVDASYAVSGGTFSSAIGEDYCAEGFIPTENEDGTFGVKVGKYVAQYTYKKVTYKFETLQEAINAAVDYGSQIVLKALGDIEITETISYVKTKSASVLLDLGGYTLTAKGCTAIQVHKGNLYVENGTITAVGLDENSAVIRVGSDDTAYAGSNPLLNIGKGTVVSAPESYGILVYGSATKGGKLTVGSTGIVEATGSKSAIAGKSDEVYNTGNTAITITGTAKVIAANSYAIYHPQAGTLDIQRNATIEGLGGIQMSAGTLNVLGNPVITATGNAGTKTEVDGVILDAAAISAVNRGFVGGAPVVNVKETPVITANGEVITAYSWTNGAESEWSEASVSVSGGTYNKLFNDKYLAVRAYFEHKDGAYNVELEKVAEVNKIRYDSLKAAINAAAAGDTVKILQDFEISEQIIINKAITIDLNGKTLTNSYYNASNVQAYGMSINATVTIKNGTYIASSEVARGICVNRNKQLIVENATIEAKGQVGIGLVAANAKCDIIGGAVVKADYAVASFGDGTTVNVENSQVVGTGCAIYHNGTNKNFTLGGNGATIIAGTEEVSESNNTATGIYVSGSATSESEYSNITLTGCTVKGGTAIEGKFVNLVLNDCNVTATATETSYNANANGAATKGFAVAVTDNATTGTPAPAGSIEITGNGVYNGIVGLGNLASVKETYSDFVDASYAVSGGTFSSAIGEDYCADGFIVSKNAQGTYSVKAGEYFFAIGEDKFGSVEDAFAVAKSGETIKLLKDYTSDKAANAATVIDLTGKTFDLNGCTFTANNFAYVFEGTGGVIKNGKMATRGSYALFIGDNGETTSFTVTGVELTGGINVYNATGVVLENLTVNGTDYYAVWLDSGAEATVKSGNYTAGAVAAVGVTVFEGNQSVLTIEGGKIDANGKPLMLANGGKLLVKGGEFTNIGKVLNEDKDNSIEISGGTFSVAVDEKYCAAGFIPTENEDGTYGVKVGEYVVKIGEVKYDSLNAAEKAAKDGDTITLIKDVVLTEQVATGKAITIDGAGFEIKAAAKLASASGKAGMFYRTASAKGTLTFKNVTLNGNGVSKIFLNEGGAGETVFDTVVSTNGGGMAYGSGIHISGGGSHATIKNSTLTGSTGTMELNDQNYYAANDLWVGGNVEVIVENSIIGTVFVNTTGAPATSVHGHLIVRGDATEIGYIAGENSVADKNGSIGSLTTIEGGSVDTIFDGGLYEISGGTFKTELKDEWLKDGFNAVRNEDGTYGVKTVFHVSDRYNGSALAEFSSLDEAFAYAAENNYKFIVVNGTYVLKSDLVIPDGKYFEVTGTLTIGEGVKVTVNKTSKRMSVLTGGKVINNGTILLLGEDGEGYFMVNGGTLEGNSLTAPEGYAIAKNGNSYRIINIATAGVKVEYEDGSVQYFNGTVLTENAKKITLLRDFEGVINIVGTSSVTYNVEIDLGGHTITKNISMGSGVITVGYANVVIKNGTVVSTSTNGTNKPALKVYSHGNVTVADDVTLDGGTVQPAIYLEGGEVALYGTATSKGGYAITTHGLNEHNTVITIKDGATVTAENGAAIYNPHGDLIIEGGVITGKIGVQICAGSLSISGNAQISATGAAEAHEGDGAVFDGSAVSIIDRAGAYTGLVSIEITGGTFTSAHGKAIRAFAYDDTTETEFDNSSKVVKVSGGTFSSEVDASLIKDGCKLISVNGAYGVFEKQILGASVTLGEDISFNYYVKTKTENTVVVVKYMKNGTMTEETLTEFVAMTNSKYAGKYVFRGITPQMIARGITVVYTDGSAYDIVENYSVADYLERAYKNANNTAETKQLAADAMYYGLAAMKYRKADEADIADVQARITELGMTQSAVEMTDSSLREGENIVQVSVRFDNANSLVFAVKNSVFEANSGYKYYIGNTEITEWNTTLIAGYHVYTTEALRAVEYVGKAFTVTVKSEGKVVQTLSTDVGSYCARIAASESYAAELKELAKATYAYGVSAKAYANRSNNG